jgi:serine/threonine-protein kinase
MLLKAIARGGMGEVYLAALGDIEGAERPCVVKLIRHEHRDDASFLARFLDEARIQAQMHHPGVAQVLEAAIDPDGRPYVVVEYVAGRDLGEIRQRAGQLKLQVSWSDAVAIAASIAEALAHVHEQTDANGRPLDVVHRDLSPQNIMVSYMGDTKLIDFGTARGENRRCQTINGIVFAKPGYVAPEVAANNPGGAASDLYALGIVLWELIAGRRFLQGDAQEHLAAVAKGERTPPALSLWLAVPRDLDTIIGRLTATRIEDRFPSAREGAEQLLKLLQQAPGLANGERSVRGRVAHLMLRLYPAEPARSRAEFAQLVSVVRRSGGIRPDWSGSPRPAVVEARDTLFPGTRYRVLREIASGPMSVVLEAQHVDLGRKVALKVLDRQRCPSAESEAQFRQEARVVAQLRHDNLVQVHDFGISADGRAYYAMEYLEGETLAERLDRLGRLPWEEVAQLGVQACQALEVAHALGIIHRDIKPQNLFLTSSGTLKLLDFGITQTEAPPERPSTESLSLVGTPEYMAPEQIGGGVVDGRADVYALGAVLYELITGCLPHTGENTVVLLDNKVHDKVKAPSQRVRKLRLPRYLDRVLLTALATDTKDRYDNVVSLRQDLVWILGSKERRQGESRRWLVGGLATVAAAAVFALVAVDGLRERIQVTALPLSSTALLSGSSAASSSSASSSAAVPASSASGSSASGSSASGSSASGSSAVPAGSAVVREPAPPSIPEPAPGLEPEPVAAASVALLGEEAATESEAAESEAAESEAAEEEATPTTPLELARVESASAVPSSAAPSRAAPSQATSAVATRAQAARPRRPAAQLSPPRKELASAAIDLDGLPDDLDVPENPDEVRELRRQEKGETTTTKGKLAAVAAPSESKPALTASSESKPVKPPARVKAISPALLKALAEADSLVERNELSALAAFRRLGREYPNEPRVLEGWSRIAATNKWWGESLRVAELWATQDASTPAQIHLARTQKRLGQVERAIGTLQALLTKRPSEREASTLLQAYGGASVALR